MRRWLIVALVVTVVAAGGLSAWVWTASERELRRTYDVPPLLVAIPTDDASIARGAHLVRSVATCTTCHGEDLGGAIYGDMGWTGIVAGPNLTSGRGGIGAEMTDRDWIRAIRYGVRKDGTSLIAMPSEVYTYMADADLGAIIAYLKQAPPVDREVPVTRFGPLGRVLLAAGRLNVLVAPKTARDVAAGQMEPGVTVEYGKYLASIAGCHGCHGHGLSGGQVAGPPGLPPAANITPQGIGHWTEADFARALREGRRPNGSSIDPFMPWQTYRVMTDEEVSALWLYLESVPRKPFGNK